jgi:hypothetical protein
MAPKLSNPDAVAYEDAIEAIQAWLAGPLWRENVLEVLPRNPALGPGEIADVAISRLAGAAIETTRQRVCTFRGVKLRVENARGVAREAEYVFRFHWQGGEWKILEPPGVCF